MNTNKIIVEHFVNSNPAVAVRVIEKHSYEDIASYIKEIPLELGAKVLIHMNNYKAAKCLELLEINDSVKLIEKFDLVSAELLLRSCSEGLSNTLLGKLTPAKAEIIRQKLKYIANSVATIMKPKVFAIPKDMNVGEAMEFMKKEKEHISSEVFITNEKGKLEGIVKISDLVVAENTDRIISVMRKEFPKFFVDEPIQSIINHPSWAEYRTIPIIDNTVALVGSLHFEDVSKPMLKKDPILSKQVVETGNALGELYRIGLTGLLQSTGKSD